MNPFSPMVKQPMQKNDRPKPTRWVSGRRARTLLCASGVSFLIMLDSNVVAVSLPSLARDLNAAFSDIEWVISAYVLTFAALLMPAGALADRFGRRRLLIFGLTTFTLASLLCGLASNALILNAARALQGIGAAFQLSAALAIPGHAFRGPDRARAFGFWGMVIGVAVAIGPPVGGLITSAFGWRWAFLVNVPVGLGLIALTLNAIAESNDLQAGRLDLSGMLFFGTLDRRTPCLSGNRRRHAADGCGAGVLNGETAKVSMSVIPPERSGMASGIGGTLRFVGLVIGITGPGSVLSRETERHFVDLASTTALRLPVETTHFLVGRLAAGDIAGVTSNAANGPHALIAELSRRSFAMGFSSVLFFAAAAVAAALTYVLVSAAETTASHATVPAASPLPDALD